MSHGLGTTEGSAALAPEAAVFLTEVSQQFSAEVLSAQRNFIQKVFWQFLI